MTRREPKASVLRPGVMLTGAAVAALSGCGKRSRAVDEWALAPGTRGVINLADVKKAFQDQKGKAFEEGIQAFEERVNKVYEGDCVVLVEVNKLKEAQGPGYIVFGKEDLNSNGTVDKSDELLFAIVSRKDVVVLRGAGANSYYQTMWDPKTGRELGEKEREPYRQYYGSHYYYHHYYSPFYYTPRTRYRHILDDRDSYRRTSAFQSQVKNNSQFESAMAKQHGAAFQQSVSKASPTRQQYIAQKQLSPGFRQSLEKQTKPSGWSVREKMVKSGQLKSSSLSRGSSRSSSSSGRSSGFFRGFRASSGFGV